MSIITANIKATVFNANEFFSFDINPRKNSTKITMKMLTSIITTDRIPATYSILKNHLPSILRSKCFNENNYRFSKEVKCTEIGHLFEHILLEYLSQFKFAQGHKNPIFNGLTSWNWKKEERGVFHIEIDAGLDDKEIFSLAMKKSADLLTFILQKAENNIPNYESLNHLNYLTLEENKQI
jgi:hypothetical protein